MSTGVSLTGGRDQEIPIKLMARDEDGNLAYIALVEESGRVLAQESCQPNMVTECTLVLTMTSPEGYGQRIKFSAVAVDQDGLRSEAISFIVGTNLPAVGGSGQEEQEGSGEEQEEQEEQEGSETPQEDESTDSSTSRRPSVSLTIGPPGELAPFIVNIASIFQPTVSYNGGHPLFYFLAEGPDGMSIDSRNGTVSWTPREAEEGRQFNVTIEVSDGQLSEETSFTVTVFESRRFRTKISRSPEGTNVLTVTDSGTSLKGMQVTSPPEERPITIRELADLQKLLELAPDGSVPEIPSWITPLSNVFVVKGAFDHPVELRIPLAEFIEELPEGVSIYDVGLYAYTEVTDADGLFWLPVGSDESFEGNDLNDAIYIVTVGGLQGLAFFGYHRNEGARPFESSNAGDEGSNPMEIGFSQSHEYQFIQIPNRLNVVWQENVVGRAAPGIGVTGNGQQTVECEIMPDTLCITPPELADIECNPSMGNDVISSAHALTYNGLDCTYSGDSDIKINIRNFGEGCRWDTPDGSPENQVTKCPEGGSVLDLAAWVITAQLGAKEMGLGYSKEIEVHLNNLKAWYEYLKRTGGVLGYVRGGFGRDSKVIHITDNNDVSPDEIQAILYHEFFHHVQFHQDTKRGPEYDLLILQGTIESKLSGGEDLLGGEDSSWLTESMATWFADELGDDLNLQTLLGIPGSRIMEVGLNSPESSSDRRAVSYSRFAFVKLLNEKCEGFYSQVKNLQNVGGSEQTETGIETLAAILEEMDCDFGDHLNDPEQDRSGSLEAAISYYNYATQFKDDISLLDLNESGFSFQKPESRFVPSIPNQLPNELPSKGSMEYILTFGEDLGNFRRTVTQIPGAGAVSASLPITRGRLPEGAVAELLIVPIVGKVTVSIAGMQDEVSQEGFFALNTIGPDRDPHAGFSASVPSFYVLSTTVVPRVFFTVVNPSLNDVAKVAILLRIRAEGIDPTPVSVPRFTLTPSTDRDSLAALFNKTGGPNWYKKNGWVMEDYPIYAWEGVETDAFEILGQVIPNLDMRSPRVTELLLGNNGLTGEIPVELASLNRLKVLSLDDNFLTGAIPPGLGDLTDLYRLDLERNQLTGSLPPELTQLSKLQFLYLSANNLNGGIPSNLGEMNELFMLDLRSNELTGQIPESTGKLTSLEYLFLSFNELTGTIPDVFANMPRLRKLDLSSNELTGTIPDVFANMPLLWELDLSSNELTGTIPDVFAKMPLLWELDLSSNELTGTIPDVFANLPELRELDLSSNELTGTIPDVFANLPELRELDLSSNELTGAIPEYLSSLSNLRSLDLGNNELDGGIPEALMNLDRLDRLFLNDNLLTGAIPERLDSLYDLEVLGLHDNLLTGAIPTTFGELYSLEELYLDENQLSGTIPEELGLLYNLERLYLQENLLTGEIPAKLGQLDILERLYLQDNQLTGTIPAELGNLSQLKQLDLSSNQLSGAIPAELGKLTNLTELDLSNNDLDGEIPTDLVNLYKLEKLFLSGNDDLEGCIPVALHQVEDNDLDNLNLEDCTDRDALVALYNATDGDNWLSSDNWLTEMEIAEWLGVMTNEDGRVVSVALNTNQLNGPIPADLANLSELSELQLNSNQLTGPIPAGLARLDNLTKLELGSNQLSGAIPSALGNLSNLTWLILSANDLSGDIPGELGDLGNLEELWLNLNQLDGFIPVELGQLTNLTGLYLSGNSFVGCIPASLSTVVNHDLDDLEIGFCGGN